MLTSNPQSSIMKDFISSNNLQLVNHGITYIKNDSFSHIDLCIVDANNTIADFSKSNGPFVHHHFLISVVLEIFVPSSTKTDFTYRNLDNIDRNSFLKSLNSYEWSNVPNMLNVNEMLNEIESNIQTTLNIHASLKIITSKRKFEPWITVEISAKQNETDYLYRRYKRNKSDERLSMYRESKTSLFQLIKIPKQLPTIIVSPIYPNQIKFGLSLET